MENLKIQFYEVSGLHLKENIFDNLFKIRII